MSKFLHNADGNDEDTDDDARVTAITRIFSENSQADKCNHEIRISMGECNTILSAYTKYRHLG